MRRFAAGACVGIFLAAPALVFAQTVDTESLLEQLYTQLILILQQELVELTKAMQPTPVQEPNPAQDLIDLASTTFSLPQNFTSISEDVTPPVAFDLKLTTIANTPVTTPLFAFNGDAEHPDLTYSFTNPSQGTLTFSSSSASITYMPASNFAGPDAFTFKVNNGAADSNDGFVSILVYPVTVAQVPIATTTSQ